MTTAVATAISALPQQLHVGVGEKPIGVPVDQATGWVVVYTAPPAGSAGTIADPYADTPIEVQISCVGWTAEQAAWLDDLVRQVLLPGTGLAIPGRTVMWVEQVAGRPTARDDQVSPPLWTAVSVYRITTTPT